MPTNPRKDPTALADLKGRRRLSKDERAERASREIYVAGGAVEPPPDMEGEALAMFVLEADYMRRVNEACGKGFYGENDAAPLRIMCEAHARYLYYAERERRARGSDNMKVFNQLKNKEAQTEKAYRQALKLDPASRVDFGAAAEVPDGEKGFNV